MWVKIKKNKRKKQEASDEEGTKVPLIAHMHFKEGRSFAVPSTQREQNEIPPLGRIQDQYADGESWPKAGFPCVVSKQYEQQQLWLEKQILLNKLGWCH